MFESGDDGDVETIFADEVEYIDAGDTIRCMLYVLQPGGGRRLERCVVMPRRGFLTAVLVASNHFVDRTARREPLVAAIGELPH